MTFAVTPLGVSSAIPAFGRNPSSQILEHADRYFLIDAGEGVQFRLQQQRIRLRRLDAIFISHLHGDHVWGLLGLLTSMSVTGREHPLRLVGPQGLRSLIDHQLELTQSQIEYPLELTELGPGGAGQLVFENRHLEVRTLPLFHRILCYGYLFTEKPKRPRFLVDHARADGMDKEYFRIIKQGKDVTLADGTTYHAANYLTDPDPSYQYAYCSDTAPHPPLLEHIQGVELLYHEATFTQAHAARAKETFHSTAQQAAEVARAAGVGQLVLGHYSARYKDLHPLRDEARAVFPRTELGLEGRTYPVAPP